jgi:hypothetical protein
MKCSRNYTFQRFFRSEKRESGGGERTLRGTVCFFLFSSALFGVVECLVPTFLQKYASDSASSPRDNRLANLTGLGSPTRENINTVAGHDTH